MNYNSLMNKPTINYRELIGDNTVSEVGGITEEEFNTLMSTDLTSYYTKAQIDDLFSRSYVYREKSGNIVTFDCPGSVNGIDQVVSEIVAVQSGSGDPSPTNVRPISGWNEVDVTVADDITNKSFFDGLMNGTYGVVDLGTLNWSYNSSLATFFTTLSNTKTQYNFEGLCCKYVKGSGDKTWNNDTYIGAGYNIYVKDSAYSTANAFKQAMNGVHFIYELATPTTPTVTPSEINELYEEFGINGQTYTIDLDGTRYGCTLDVVNGVLTVDRAYVDLGTLTWAKNTDYQFYATLPNDTIAYQDYHLCSQYITSARGAYDLNVENSITLSRTFAWIYDVNQNDLTAFQSAMDGVQLVYELATPQTIQLTPTAVKSLLGTNNLWADSGDITVTALDKII